MLIIETLGGHSYTHANVTNVREAKSELRWTNANSEPRSMAWKFILSWQLDGARHVR